MLKDKQERGKRMALSNVALFGGAFLTPVVAGKISHSMGWQWTFYFVAIFTAAAFPLMFFFVPETAFRRAHHLNTDFEGDADRSHCQHGPHAGDRNMSESQRQLSDAVAENGAARNDEEAALSALEEKGIPSSRDGEVPQGTVPAKASFVQSLKLFNGRKTDEDFLKLLLRPFPLFLHPGILWVSLLAHDA